MRTHPCFSRSSFSFRRATNSAWTEPCEHFAMRAISRLCKHPHNREIARIAKCSHGSVHAELVVVRKEKQLKDKLERERMVSEISQSSNRSSAIISELNLSPEKLQIVRGNIETAAKAAVQEIQGQYYETVD